MSTPDFLNSPISTSRNIQMVLTPRFFSTAKKRWTKTHVLKKPTISSKPHQFWRDMYRNLTLDVLEFCFRTLVVFQPSRPNRSCNDPSSQDAEVKSTVYQTRIYYKNLMLLVVAGILGRVSASHLSEVVKTCGTPHPKLLSPFDSIRGHHCFLIAKDPRKRKVFRIISFHGSFLGGNKKTIWVFPRIGIPQNGWFTMENPIKMDDLGGPPLFLETPI